MTSERPDSGALVHELSTLALEHVADGVFLADPSGVVRLWNPAAERITGLPASIVVGRRPEDSLPGWRQVAERVPVAAAPAPSRKRTETLPLEVGGRDVWISISGVAFSEGVVYAFRDLTEERAVEELKNEFVATVSHEVRTPLAAIYGAAVTLARKDLALEERDHDRLVAVVAQEARRLARIVNEILVANQLDAGRLGVTEEQVDPLEAASAVVEAARVYAPDDVAIELAPANGLPPVAADPERLRQVLANLVENAVKYSPDGGRIRVSVEEQPGRVRFAVRDEGLGIPPAEQQRVFEKFYRLDPQLTRGVGGTGLGLYICRELVRRMGGRIWVASAAGEGATFFVDLPVTSPRPHPTPA